MTELQKEFEATGYASYINANLYPDGKIYTQEYTQWLERQVLALRQTLVIGQNEQLVCSNCDGEGFRGKGTNEILPCLSCFGSGERIENH